MSPLQSAWKKLSSSEQLKRSSHSVATIDGKLYVFGGELVPRQPRDNELFQLSTHGNDTPTANTSDSKPTPRVGATMIALDSKLYVFSGRGGVAMAPIDENGAIQVFDIAQATWSSLLPVDTSAPVPEPRSYHCATTDSKDKIFIHAGCPEKGRLKDLWVFHIAARSWSKLQDAPGPSRGGSSITYTEEKLWRMNGFDGREELGGSVDVYDISRNSWTTVEYTADGKSGPGARSVSSLLAISIDGKPHLVTMFGEADPSSLGHAGAGKMLSDVWAFDIQDSTWKQLKWKDNDSPTPRGWFDANVVADGKIAIAGGLADSNERLGDVWLLSVH